MTGQRQLAMDKLREALSELPAEFVKAAALKVESFFSLPLEAMIRFGMWNDVLTEPDIYADHMPFTRAFHHAARAIAYAAKGDPTSARKEQAIYHEKSAHIPKETEVGNNTSADILELINHMLEGEILIADGKGDAGMAELRTALKLEDNLKYDEPPAWMIPIRHSLGANLMAAGKYAEAEQIYRDDLKRLPGNGWSLYGLSQSLAAQKKDEASTVKAQFEQAWAKADMKINSSCLCRPGI
jgi:tetratricopeptide (TPR) repeat protein